MKTTTVKVSEGFHSVRPITLRIRNDKITPHQRSRLMKHMCGIKTCTCQPYHGWRIEGLNDGWFLFLLSHAEWQEYKNRRDAR